MKKYEAVFVLDIRKVEDEGKAFSEEFSKNVGDWGGSVSEIVPMGRKPFMREIKKRKAGIYWDFVFELDPAKEKEIREFYRLDDRIVRILIINYDRPENVRSDISSVEPVVE